jgi:hypothetical protein
LFDETTTTAFHVHCRPIKAILGSKEAEETNLLEFFLKVGFEGGGGGCGAGGDVPDDGLREKHKNLAMAGTLRSLEKLSTLRHHTKQSD